MQKKKSQRRIQRRIGKSKGSLKGRSKANAHNTFRYVYRGQRLIPIPKGVEMVPEKHVFGNLLWETL